MATKWAKSVRRAALTSELVPYLLVGVVMIAAAGSAAAALFGVYQRERAQSEFSALVSHVRGVYGATGYPQALGARARATLPRGFYAPTGADALGAEGEIIRHARWPDVRYQRARAAEPGAFLLSIEPRAGQALAEGQCASMLRHVVAEQFPLSVVGISGGARDSQNVDGEEAAQANEAAAGSVFYTAADEVRANIAVICHDGVVEGERLTLSLR